MKLISLFLSSILLLSTFGCLLLASAQTPSPVIGILSQPVPIQFSNNGRQQYIIAASYVKWVEAGGARSIPIPYDASPALVKDLFGQIDALLLPGGASDVPESVFYLLTLALKEGRFPVWGTCLGFEYLVQVMSSNSSSQILGDDYDAENISLPLYQVQPAELYQDDHILDIVQNYNVTMNNHHKGLHPQRFRDDPQLTHYWTITSMNVDRQGKPFVSTIEPKDPDTFPWYGIQYHPEKNVFEYGTYPGTNIPYEAIDHSEQAVEFSLYLARFFVGLVSSSSGNNNNKNERHSYTKPEKYPLVDTYPIKLGVAFEQYYIIPSAEHWEYSSDEYRRYQGLRKWNAWYRRNKLTLY